MILQFTKSWLIVLPWCGDVTTGVVLCARGLAYIRTFCWVRVVYIKIACASGLAFSEYLINMAKFDKSYNCLKTFIKEVKELQYMLYLTMLNPVPTTAQKRKKSL